MDVNRIIENMTSDEVFKFGVLLCGSHGLIDEKNCKNLIMINELTNLSLMMLVIWYYSNNIKNTIQLPQFDRKCVVVGTKMKYFKYFKLAIYYICILLYWIPT